MKKIINDYKNTIIVLILTLICVLAPTIGALLFTISPNAVRTGLCFSVFILDVICFLAISAFWEKVEIF